MKALILHNPKAGDGSVSQQELEAAFKAVDCKTIYQSIKDKDFNEIFNEKADLVVAAGGDGAIRKILRAMAGTVELPVLVLALGTANNLAGSMGVYDDWKNRVDRLRALNPRPFYYGKVSSGKWNDLFFEGVGFGVFAEHLKIIEEHPEVVEQMSADGPGYTGTYKAMARLAEEVQSCLVSLDVNGESISRKYIWLELLNIPNIGPHLHLYSPEGSQRSEEFHLLELTNRQRETTSNWFNERHKTSAKVNLPVRLIDTALPIKMSGRIETLHVDDEYIHWPLEKNEERILEIMRVKHPMMILK